MAVTKLYLHTDEGGWTRGSGGEVLGTRWGAGFSHSRKSGFPAYTDPALADLFDPAFSEFAYNLWEAETESAVHMDSLGIRAYARDLRTVREIRASLPVLQHVKFALLCTTETYKDDVWQAKAKAWLAGDHASLDNERFSGTIRKTIIQPEATLAAEAASSYYHELEHRREKENTLVELARKSYSTSSKDDIEYAVGKARTTASLSTAYNATQIVRLAAQAAVRSAESAKYSGKKIDFAGLVIQSRI